MNTKVYSVHGFASPNGRGQTDLFQSYFEQAGYEFIQKDYGFVLLLGVAIGNKKRAQELVDVVEPDSIGFGHSNGCAILAEASRMGAPFSQLVFLSPALPNKPVIGSQVKHIHVYWSKYDFPLAIASWFKVLGWGSLGRVGPDGSDSRFIGYNKGSKQEFPREQSYTHLDIFFRHKIEYFGPLIVQNVKEMDKGNG